MREIPSPVLDVVMSSKGRPTLKLAWCSYDAAKFAAKRFHYARSLPCSKTARVGCWESDRFIGAVIFAWGANKSLAGEYGLKMTEVAELCRIALDRHETPVSRIVMIAVRMLKRAMPGLRLIISYSDPERGHTGAGVYQAMGWTYVGESKGPGAILLNGKVVHRRTINSKYQTSAIPWLRQHVDPDARLVPSKPKFKYLLPLDQEIAQRVRPLAKPYPKKRATSETSDTPGVHPGEGRAARTVALQC